MPSWSDMNFNANIKDISTNIVSELIGSKHIGEPVMSEVSQTAVNSITRNEVIAEILSTFVGLAASFGITYYGIKWLSENLDPTKKEKKLAQEEAQRMLNNLGVENVAQLTDYELCIAANLLDPNSLSVEWGNIGGLETIIDDIQETVILPFKHHKLFRNSSLLQPPKGILLHGPPGCGKTMIAKATAKASGARFINLQVSTLVDKWYGESQKRAEAVFSLAVKLQPTIVFIDEIDSFLRSRTSSDHEATAMMKTQFMSLWDGLVSDPKCRVMVMGATNRPQDVDAAILRRMPSQFYVGMPGQSQRESIIRLILENEDTDDINYGILAQLSEGLSGSDLREACRAAAVSVVHEFVQAHARELAASENGSGDDDREEESEIRNLSIADLQTAINKVKATKVFGVNPNNFALD